MAFKQHWTFRQFIFSNKEVAFFGKNCDLLFERDTSAKQSSTGAHPSYLKSYLKSLKSLKVRKSEIKEFLNSYCKRRKFGVTKIFDES